MPMPDDDQWPGRPRHPDMELLSRAVIENDTRSEQGEWWSRLTEYVDVESITYMVTQRAGRVGGGPAVAAGMIDGFMLGVVFAELKRG